MTVKPLDNGKASWFAGSPAWRMRLWRRLRNPIVRYVAAAIAGIVLIILVFAWLTTMLVESWSERDVELRSRLVFRSIREQLTVAIAARPEFDTAAFFQRLAEDERIFALGFCGGQGEVQFATNRMPSSITCRNIDRYRGEALPTVTENGRRIHVRAFAVTIGQTEGHLLVLHDLAYVDQRVKEARRYVVLALVGLATGLGILGALIAAAVSRAWANAVRHTIETGRPSRDAFPISREVRQALREMRFERRFADGIHVEWSPKTLQQVLVDELPGTQVLVVSNREPYIHNRNDDGSIALQTPASGLVAAMEPVMRACGGTWIAHGSGSADRDTVDADDRIRVPPANPAYTLRRLWLTDEEQDGYYYGFANEGLWPLCHIAFVRPTFRAEDWAHYKAVNARFADAVVREALQEDPIILVQDYHLALLPRLIRERLPRATIITFWHIPWPNAETFGICPWREEIIDGLLGSTILGFHTQFHCNNFLEGADRFIESRIDREHSSIALRGGETLVRPYPISIEWPPVALETQESVERCRAVVRARLGVADDIKLAVGIERFDYTKGILDRMRAVDDLLTRHPEWKGRFVFAQAAAPTRSKLGAYSALQKDAESLAAEINARHGGGDYQPIHLIIRHHERDEVYELFRAADMCMVSSLHDGMNLVAKEFVAARDDEQGVLILSSFAGASRELGEALIVNPYDTHGMAEGIYEALRMPSEQQRDRMRLMRDQVRQRNVYRWAAQMLLDAARLRRRETIQVVTSQSGSN